MKNLEYAGFWKRFVAWAIDILLIYVVFFIVNHIIFHQTPIMSIIKIASVWLYFACMESSSTQATLGKMAVQIVVVDYKGKKVSFGRASGRYFAKLVSDLTLLFGYFIAGWTEKKQALHDMIASTYVVDKK